MASANTLCKKLLNVKNTVVESHYFHTDTNGVNRLRIMVRPYKRHQNDCPFCHRRNLPRYDSPSLFPNVWRGLDFGRIVVDSPTCTYKVTCPEHGIATALNWPPQI